MNSINKALTLVLLTCLFSLSYQVTYSFFSDTAESSNNTFAASSTFPTPTPSPSPCPSPLGTHIVINEVFSDGNKKKEWVELYNPTCSSVDLSGWKIADGNQTDTLPSASPIPVGGYSVVIANPTDVTGIPGTAITIQLSDNDIGNGLQDNGDSLHLKNPSDTIVDEMSYGTNTSVFASPPPAPTLTQSLQRIPNGTDTDSASDWTRTTLTKGITN